ncbi:MAG TPA: SAM-dependent methyltransferase [Acidimicrobiia bacterium]|nr:SAM-dependent methyltransferase [Acidimicrobiia bacterium]
MNRPPVTQQRPTAAARWANALAAWAIPEHLLAAAPSSPWEFSTSLFTRAASRAVAGERRGPAQERALEALPEGGSVIDVGVGGGAACLPLATRAGLLVGVDSSRALLEAFAGAAAALGVPHRTVEGSWPGVAPEVEPADIGVSHHVLYNIAELVPFVLALTDHARRRVVIEITADHPMASSNQLWAAIHGIERPASPTWVDALDVLAEAGLDITYEESVRETLGPPMDRAEAVAHARRRLCVGPERDAEIDALLPPDEGMVRRVVAVWWDGRA